MTKDLTAGFAERVKVEKRTDFYDTKLTGFVLRVTENGKKTWAVAYRHQGQNRRVTLGTFPVLNATEARKAARIALRDAQLGSRPGGSEARDSDHIRRSGRALPYRPRERKKAIVERGRADDRKGSFCPRGKIDRRQK